MIFSRNFDTVFALRLTHATHAYVFLHLLPTYSALRMYRSQPSTRQAPRPRPPVVSPLRM